MMPKISISFVSEKLRTELLKLKEGDYSERKLYSYINIAFHDVENDLSSCIKIPKKLWPKDYTKYAITNLWKYNLPHAWRLIFTLEKNDSTTVAVILEWLSHKEYERRFAY